MPHFQPSSHHSHTFLPQLQNHQRSCDVYWIHDFSHNAPSVAVMMQLWFESSMPHPLLQEQAQSLMNTILKLSFTPVSSALTWPKFSVQLDTSQMQRQADSLLSLLFLSWCFYSHDRRNWLNHTWSSFINSTSVSFSYNNPLCIYNSNILYAFFFKLFCIVFVSLLLSWYFE